MAIRLLPRQSLARSRSALVRVGGAIGRVAGAVGRGVAAEIGRDELLIAVALTLIGYGLWLTPWRPAAFIVPGLVLLWMALPTRRVFIVKQPPVQAGSSPRRAS